jgi:hypothetical protein
MVEWEEGVEGGKHLKEPAIRHSGDEGRDLAE